MINTREGMGWARLDLKVAHLVETAYLMDSSTVTIISTFSDSAIFIFTKHTFVFRCLTVMLPLVCPLNPVFVNR